MEDGKICKKCDVEYPLTSYKVVKDNRDGRSRVCTPCLRQIRRETWHSLPLEERQRMRREQYLKHKESENKASVNWSKRHPEKIREYGAKHRKTVKHRERNRLYMRAKRRNDPIFRLVGNLRCRLAHLLKRENRPKTTLKYLGCTIIELKEHLSSQFAEGMSWDNYGEWHVDHIRPIASFNLAREEDLCAALHFSNLCPLWADENRKKGCKWNADMGLPCSA